MSSASTSLGPCLGLNLIDMMGVKVASCALEAGLSSSQEVLPRRTAGVRNAYVSIGIQLAKAITAQNIATAAETQEI